VDDRARVSVCLPVREHISSTTFPIFTNFLCMLPMSVARSSSCGVALGYVLPVLWMTSCLYLMARNSRRNSDSIGSSLNLSLRLTRRGQHRTGRSLISMTALFSPCFACWLAKRPTRPTEKSGDLFIRFATARISQTDR